MSDIRSETSGTNQGKMERHFSSKVNFQPDRSVPFTFRPKFRLHHSEMPLETRIYYFCKWNGTCRSDRTDRSKRTVSRGGPKYSGRTEPKRTLPFDFSPKFPEILASWKAPLVTRMAEFFICACESRV